MNLELSDHRIAIAGSSKGLGFAIAKAFASENAKIWISGRNADDLSRAADKLGTLNFTNCDLEFSEGQNQFFTDIEKKWEYLDTLILNIGSGQSSYRSIETPDEEWRRVFDLNFFSHTALIRLMVPLLAKSKTPSIISISSIAGQTRIPAPISYSSAKAALDQFCVSMASDLGASNIRYNVIAPGNILTPGGAWEARLKSQKDETEKYIQTNVPLKTFAKPEDIAAFVVFLSSSHATFCTGSIIRIDGGQTPHR